MKKALTILIIISIALNLSITALAHTASVTSSGFSEYKSVRLSREILNNANKNLSDLRITGVKGAQVAYFLTDSETTIETINGSHRFLKIDSYLKDDKQVFDFELEEKVESDIMATGLFVRTNNEIEFVNDVQVSGSYDSVNWEAVTDGQIFKVDNHVKYEVLFDETEKFTYYRLTLSGAAEPINIEEIELKYEKDHIDTNHFSEEFAPRYKLSVDDENRTVIVISGVKNLNLKDITFDTEGMFARVVDRPNHYAQEIYNLTFKKDSYKNTTVSLYKEETPTDEITLYIENNDDAPIMINGMVISYYTKDVVFKDNGSPRYKLEFSGKTDAVMPVYDIETYREQVLNQSIDSLEIDRVEIIPEEIVEDVEPIDYTWLLNIIVGAVAIILIVIIIFSIKNRKPTE